MGQKDGCLGRIARGTTVLGFFAVLAVLAVLVLVGCGNGFSEDVADKGAEAGGTEAKEAAEGKTGVK